MTDATRASHILQNQNALLKSQLDHVNQLNQHMAEQGRILETKCTDFQQLLSAAKIENDALKKQAHTLNPLQV
jgi:hypothetical protein